MPEVRYRATCSPGNGTRAGLIGDYPQLEDAITAGKSVKRSRPADTVEITAGLALTEAEHLALTKDRMTDQAPVPADEWGCHWQELPEDDPRYVHEFIPEG